MRRSHKSIEDEYLERIRLEMRIQEVSIKDLAEAMGESRQLVSRRLRGTRPMPVCPTLLRICDVLNLDAGGLLVKSMFAVAHQDGHGHGDGD